MGISGSTGLEQFWIDGLPIPAIPTSDPTVNPGSEEFWIDGLPFQLLYPLPSTSTADTVPILVSIPDGSAIVGVVATTGVVSILVYTPGPNALVGTISLADPVDLDVFVPDASVFFSTITSIADVVSILTSIPSPNVTLGSFTSTTDPVDVRVLVGPGAFATAIAVFPVACVGLMQSRVGSVNVEADRRLLHQMGCNVVGEEYYAGVTWLWVYFPFRLLPALLDENFRIFLPGTFAQVASGTLPYLPTLKHAFSHGRQFRL